MLKDFSHWQEFGDLKQAHSELQLLYRERTLELEKTADALALHGDTYKKLHRQVSYFSLLSSFEDELM